MNVAKIIENIELSPIEVRHQDLKRYGDSAFKSKCPNCLDGFLGIQRDIISLKLQPQDNCLFCGRRFIYTDIEESINLEYKNNSYNGK